MVLIQSVSWLILASSLCIAVILYALNLRLTARSRRVALTYHLMQPLMSEEGNKRFIELMNAEWKDIDDFNIRYNPRSNPEFYSKRIFLWSLCDSLGYLSRKNLIDINLLFSVSNLVIQSTWVKFKPIIYDYRKTEYNESAFNNFEFLIDALNKAQARIDVAKADREKEQAEHESMRYLAYNWWPQNAR